MSLLDTKKQYHLDITKDDIGKYVILTGDPGRVEEIAKFLNESRFIASKREYTTYTGFLFGERVSVCSTGIGGPSAAIAVEELAKCGAHTFIRVGTSGGMKLSVLGGDLVIASAAVRSEGTTKEYLPEGYPAAADYSVIKALAESAEEISQNCDGQRFHIGVVHSKDSFYGETNPETMPVYEKLKNDWEAYLKAGCLTSEMECAAIFAVSQVRGVRAGAVLTALWNVERAKTGDKNFVVNSSERAIKCAVGAMERLIKRDKGEDL